MKLKKIIKKIIKQDKLVKPLTLYWALELFLCLLSEASTPAIIISDNKTSAKDFIVLNKFLIYINYYNDT
jgi:hypothetical protein